MSSRIVKINDCSSGHGGGKRILPALLCLLSVAALPGCAVLGGGDSNNAAPKSATILMQEARAAQEAGDSESAIALFRRAARQNPVVVDPWLRIAQIRFDDNDYIEALMAAEEAVQRDRSSKVGNSIILVSGLRLAERSIGVLRADEKLNGSVRSEAESLARQLRETLGQQSLVGATASSHRRRRAAPRRTSSRSASASQSVSKTQPAQPKATVTPASGAGNTTDEFGSGSGGGNSLNPFESLQTLPQ